MPHLNDDVVFLSQLQKAIRIGHCLGDRLFDEYMLPSPDALFCNLSMNFCGRYDGYAVAVFDQFIYGSKSACSIFFGNGVSAIIVNIIEAGKQAFSIFSQMFHMVPSQVTHTDDTDFGEIVIHYKDRKYNSIPVIYYNSSILNP